MLTKKKKKNLLAVAYMHKNLNCATYYSPQPNLAIFKQVVTLLQWRTGEEK